MVRLAALALLVLASCAHPVAAPTPVCPAVTAYKPAEQKALAQAVEALPADSPLVGTMIDYGRLRASARACASVKP